MDGKEFTNYDDYPSGALGNIPLRTALANSCNTAFISQAGRLDGTDLFDAGVSLGVGLDHDLGFPAYFGSVEPADVGDRSAAADDRSGHDPRLADGDGHGDRLGPDGAAGRSRAWSTASRSAHPTARSRSTATEAAQLQAMLRGVVTDGSGRGLADVPGPPVIAKTGTAEFGTRRRTCRRTPG